MLRADTLFLKRHAKAGRINVLKNDFDPDGDHLMLTHVTKPRHGKITCSRTGHCVYKPGKSFLTCDRVRYTASDGRVGLQKHGSPSDSSDEFLALTKQGSQQSG